MRFRDEPKKFSTRKSAWHRRARRPSRVEHGVSLLASDENIPGTSYDARWTPRPAAAVYSLALPCPGGLIYSGRRSGRRQADRRLWRVELQVHGHPQSDRGACAWRTWVHGSTFKAGHSSELRTRPSRPVLATISPKACAGPPGQSHYRAPRNGYRVGGSTSASATSAIDLAPWPR